mmetsp:Transcript_10885/g.24308  ORF Transcript_10885/g.24308 Transcript_10885/m.24308 type:complete len:236 (+) Transcript_10885:2137-2844(+)
MVSLVVASATIDGQLGTNHFGQLVCDSVPTFAYLELLLLSRTRKRYRLPLRIHRRARSVRPNLPTNGGHEISTIDIREVLGLMECVAERIRSQASMAPIQRSLLRSKRLKHDLLIRLSCPSSSLELLRLFLTTELLLHQKRPKRVREPLYPTRRSSQEPVHYCFWQENPQSWIVQSMPGCWAGLGRHWPAPRTTATQCCHRWNAVAPTEKRLSSLAVASCAHNYHSSVLSMTKVD